MFIITFDPAPIGREIMDIAVGEDVRVTVGSMPFRPFEGGGEVTRRRWTKTYSAPLAILGENIPASVAEWLVSGDGPFAGGSVVSEATYNLYLRAEGIRRQVKKLRDQHERRGVTTAHGVFDTDPDSQRKISGAVQMAMIAAQNAQAFSIDWRLQNNTLVSLDAAAMIDVGVIVGQHVSACQERKNELDAMIDAALADADPTSALDGVESALGTGWPT